MSIQPQTDISDLQVNLDYQLFIFSDINLSLSNIIDFKGLHRQFNFEYF